MKTLEIHLKSISPLIMNNATLCDPLDPRTKEVKELTCIRKKQDEHHIKIAQLQYQASVYFRKDIGIHITPEMILGCSQGLS